MKDNKRQAEPTRAEVEEYKKLARKAGWTGKFTPPAKDVKRFEELNEKYPRLKDQFQMGRS